MSGKNFLPQVKEQYEALPYPPRNPADERERLIQRIGDCLIVLNHHCFGGRRDFRDGFRALVAGGGTGDSTLYLAEQLRHLPGEVVHLDLSEAAMEIARQRAEVRKLGNIRWLNASIMDLPELGLEPFDYINCTGVLHHLESSEAGLAMLERVLRPGGVILLMLYGKYGRRSVYDMQALLRGFLPADAAIADKIRMTRQLLAVLPGRNSFRRELDTWRMEIAPEGFGDAGLYDLLLHSQDRCFDVPELYALAASANLDILAFVDRADAYDPRTHVRPGIDARHLDGYDLRRRQAIAELMVGNLSAHEFYLGHRGINEAASLDDERNALVLLGAMHGHHREIGEGMTPGRTITFTGRSGTLTVTGTAVNRVLFAHMDGVTPLSRVYDRVQAAVPGIDRAAVAGELRDLYAALHARGHLFLIRAGHYGLAVPRYQP